MSYELADGTSSVNYTPRDKFIVTNARTKIFSEGDIVELHGIPENDLNAPVLRLVTSKSKPELVGRYDSIEWASLKYVGE